MLLLTELLASAPVGAPEVNIGWTPAATMGLIQNLLLGGGGGVALKIFANHLIAMRKIADQRAQQVDARGDAQNSALTARVTELEGALVAERRDCNKQLSEMRRDYDKQLAEQRAELREMQTKLDGFVRQMIAFQTSEARAMPLPPATAKAMQSLDKIKGVGE